MFPAVRFSVVSHAAWAPGLETEGVWRAWSFGQAIPSGSGAEPLLAALPPLRRRRIGFLGKMALVVAFACLGGALDIYRFFLCGEPGMAREAGRRASEWSRHA